MGRRRRIALLLLCAVSLSLVVSSSAFTSTTPERSVDVAVVEDENAYLGIQSESELQCGNPTQNTILQNQFVTTLEKVTVEVRNPSASEESLRVSRKGGSQKKELAPGERTQIKFDGSYSTGDGPRLKINPGDGTTPEIIYISVVEATGPGITVSSEEREFSVHCASEETPDNVETGTESDG